MEDQDGIMEYSPSSPSEQIHPEILSFQNHAAAGLLLLGVRLYSPTYSVCLICLVFELYRESTSIIDCSIILFLFKFRRSVHSCFHKENSGYVSELQLHNCTNLGKNVPKK